MAVKFEKIEEAEAAAPPVAAPAVRFEPVAEPRGLAGEALHGINRGIAELIDVFARPVAMGLQQFGLDVPTNPAQAGFYRAGIALPPESEAGRRMQAFTAPVGGSAIPFGGLATAATRTGTTAAAPVLRAIAARPGAALGAETAAALGAGAGSVVGEEVAGTPGAIIGGLTGAVAPGAMTGATRMAFRGRQNRMQDVQSASPITGRTETQQVPDTLQNRMAAFERMGVPVSAGQAGAGPVGRVVEAATGAVPVGGRQVAGRFAERQTEATRRAVERTVRDVAGGDVPTATEAGAAIRAGVKGYADRLEARANALYGRLDEMIPPETPVEVSNFRQALQELTEPTPGATALSGARIPTQIRQMAENLDADLAATGRLPYQAIKEQRTALGERIGSPGLAGDDIRTSQLRRLYAALSRDMEAAAEAAGPEARRMFNRANALYARGSDYIERELAPAVKKLDDEGIFTAIERGNREGGSRLTRFRTALTPDQWRTVSAAIVNRLGRAVSSRQGAAGDTFSAESFLTNWDKFSPEARRALFPSRSHRKAVNDLATIAQRIREGADTLRNPSGTADRQNAVLTLMAAMTAPQYTLGPLAQAAGASAAGAALMTSQPFVRWLAQTTRAPLAQIPRQIDKLAALAEDEPEIAPAIEAYRDALSGAGAQPRANTPSPSGSGPAPGPAPSPAGTQPPSPA